MAADNNQLLLPQITSYNECMNTPLPSIAFLHQRNNQAPLSRSSVAPSCAHCPRGPSQRDGGDAADGSAPPTAGFAGEITQKCDEFLYKGSEALKDGQGAGPAEPIRTQRGCRWTQHA
ncbi:hypothetical protein fugu_015779 [Takifugu bimaculatus]|uniref:Uncharacterized protein n=1 Tax=Takifugu bimaculatus TaxID=433685 RepID=A0A4Z2BWL6_9TELE|nr:hypothetical protein fugu_015779 [Takifugu bimaculatus]